MSLSAKDVLNGATVSISLGGYKTFNFGLTDQSNNIYTLSMKTTYVEGSLGYFRYGQYACLIVLKFLNNTDFKMRTADFRPIYMFRNFNETITCDGTSGVIGEDTFFLSYDKEDSRTRVDLSSMSYADFATKTVYLKNFLTGRSFGLVYLPAPNSNKDNTNHVRSNDIGVNQVPIQFAIYKNSPLQLKFNAMNGDPNTLTTCCANQFGTTDDDKLASQVCGILNYLPTSSACQAVVPSTTPTTTPTIPSTTPTTPTVTPGTVTTPPSNLPGTSYVIIPGVSESTLPTTNTTPTTTPTTMPSTAQTNILTTITTWIKSNFLLFIVFIIIAAILLKKQSQPIPYSPYVAYQSPVIY